MSLRISHSSIRTYSECGLRYKFHYLLRLRSKVISGALLFGSALDKALGTLLDTRDINKAKEQLAKIWTLQEINGELTTLPWTTKVVYAQKDYDGDLIFEKDEQKFEEVKKRHNIQTDKSLKQLTAFYRELKKEKGHAGLTEEQKLVYNYGHWICMFNKGCIMLEGYNQHILPRIKKVLVQQKRISIKNVEGDEITGYIDLIAEMEDDKIYILDHKTSSMEYESDAATTSPQLILYYHAEKEAYKATGVGFIVLYKQLNKNKKKLCSKCEYDGSGGRHKTCPNEITHPDVVSKLSDGTTGTLGGYTQRCNGEWNETIAPEGRYDVILNDVTEAAEALVMDTFDLSAEGIKKASFVPNLNACGSANSEYRCPFFNKCWKNDDSDLIELKDK